MHSEYNGQFIMKSYEMHRTRSSCGATNRSRFQCQNLRYWLRISRISTDIFLNFFFFLPGLKIYSRVSIGINVHPRANGQKYPENARITVIIIIIVDSVVSEHCYGLRFCCCCYYCYLYATVSFCARLSVFRRFSSIVF